MPQPALVCGSASGRRAQASIEVLVALAALFAFLAIILPSASKAFDASRFQSIYSSEKKFFGELAFHSRNAVLLSEGTRFSFNALLPAENTSIRFVEAGGLLEISFWAGGKSRNFSESFPQAVYAPSKNFSEGAYSFSVFNNGSGIVVSGEKSS